MSNLLHEILQLIRQRWWLAAFVSSALAVAATCVRIFESQATRQKRAEQKKTRALRLLVDDISSYAKRMRRQFPSGAVVVSEEDLAAQLRKRRDSIVTALNVLLKEQKVQRTQLAGFWRLNG
jgi:hypothetical protein